MRSATHPSRAATARPGAYVDPARRLLAPPEQPAQIVRRGVEDAGGQRRGRGVFREVRSWQQPSSREDGRVALEALRIEQGDDVERGEPGAEHQDPPLARQRGDGALVPGVEDAWVVGEGRGRQAGRDPGGEHDDLRGEHGAVGEVHAAGVDGDGRAAHDPELGPAPADGLREARDRVGPVARPAAGDAAGDVPAPAQATTSSGRSGSRLIFDAGTLRRKTSLSTR